MNKKMSELFHEFVHDDELNGNDEIIRETNAVVAEDDIEVRTMLDDRVGEKYFYRCMELAENVIKSFEDEQSQLNDNQKIVLRWLMEKYTVTNIEPVELIWRLKVNSVKTSYRNMPVYKNYRYMTKYGQAKVLQIFSQWVLDQEETE